MKEKEHRKKIERDAMWQQTLPPVEDPDPAPKITDEMRSNAKFLQQQMSSHKHGLEDMTKQEQLLNK